MRAHPYPYRTPPLLYHRSTFLLHLPAPVTQHSPNTPTRQPGNPAVDFKMNNLLISLNSLKPESNSLNSLSSLLKNNIHWSASQFSFQVSPHKKEGHTSTNVIEMYFQILKLGPSDLNPPSFDLKTLDG